MRNDPGCMCDETSLHLRLEQGSEPEICESKIFEVTLKSTTCAYYFLYEACVVRRSAAAISTHSLPSHHEDGIRDSVASRGLGDVYKRQSSGNTSSSGLCSFGISA